MPPSSFNAAKKVHSINMRTIGSSDLCDRGQRERKHTLVVEHEHPTRRKLPHTRAHPVRKLDVQHRASSLQVGGLGTVFVATQCGIRDSR